jgi:serine/threonine protein kinase/tetratricopeptide (TPR) repeat protein
MAKYTCSDTDSVSCSPDGEGGPAKRFSLIRQIGEGSTAAVYLAWDCNLKKQIALKLFHPMTPAETLARQEVVFGQRLQHPGFVRVYDVVDHVGATGISMELVEGATLRTVLGKSGALPVGAVIQLGLQLCQALSYAHDRDIAHCDLKPENILLDRSGATRITDFTFCVSLRDHRELRESRGTTWYMSPEQQQYLPVDQSTDVYSLGMILAEAALGRQLPSAAITQSDTSADVDAALEDIPGVLRPILIKCLAVNPRDRFRNAGELGVALNRALRPSINSRLRSLLSTVAGPRRVPAIIGLLAITLLGLGYGTWAIRRAGWAPDTIAILPIESGPNTIKTAAFIYEQLWSQVGVSKQVHVWMLPPEVRSGRKPPESYDRANRVVSLAMLDNTHCKVHISRRLLWRFRRSSDDVIWASSPVELVNTIAKRLTAAGLMLEAETEMVALKHLSREQLEAFVESSAWRGTKSDLLSVEARLRDLNGIIAANPSCAVCYLRRAQIRMIKYNELHNRDDLDGVRADASRALAFRHSQRLCIDVASLYLHLNDADAAMKLLKQPELKLLAMQPALTLEGQLLARNGSTDFAISVLRQSLALNPLDVKAENALGFARMDVNDYLGAATAFSRILKLNPDDHVALHNMALAMLRADQIEQARALFERLVSMAPSAESYSNLGIALVYAGRPRVALPNFEKAAMLNPQSVEVIGYLAHAYRWCGLGDQAKNTYLRAIQLAEKSLRNNPRGTVYLDLAVYYAALGERDKFEQYIQLARSQRDVLYYDVQSMEAQGYAILDDSSHAEEVLRSLVHTGLSVSDIRRNPDFAAFQSILK